MARRNPSDTIYMWKVGDMLDILVKLKIIKDYQITGEKLTDVIFCK